MPHLNEPIENSNLIENSTIKKANGVGYNSELIFCDLPCIVVDSLFHSTKIKREKKPQGI